MPRAPRLLDRWLRRNPPDLASRRLLPVSHEPASAAELIDRYRAAGLKVTAELPSELLKQPLAALVIGRVLAAAHRHDVADVGFTGELDHELQLHTTARTIDRSVAVAYARELGLLDLREQVESAGGRVTRANSRFAIFHFDVTLPR